MEECEQFLEGSRQRAICEGTVDLPAHKINRYRERWGLAPLEGLVAVEKTPKAVAVVPSRRLVSARKPGRRAPRKSIRNRISRTGGCIECTSSSERTPKRNGYGPGSRLVKIMEEAGIPHCPKCLDLAAKMDRWGKAACVRRMDHIVADILPRAREWLTENKPVVHKFLSIVAVEDFALKKAIRRKVQQAIDSALARAPPQRRKPRPVRNNKTTLHRPDDKSNLISSTAIGQPTYTLGTHAIVERIPFTAESTRNLIYHVWPSACDDVWRWNLDLLLEYIGQFNGRRIVAIAVDHEADAEAVQDHLAGEVLEFMIFRNNPKAAEMVSFLPLLAQVESYDPNAVTFRAHTKGTHRICKEKKPHLREWVELLYRTNLGDWPTVREHLESSAMTGAFRKFDQFNKRRPTNKPSYSGSFYWFRNCFVFSREWYRVDEPRWGCESWPAKMFSMDETRCLFLDETGSMYSADYWRHTVKPAYGEWLKTRGLA